MRPLEADAIIACLHRHDVRYVLIGGLAAILHGSPLVTFDAGRPKDHAALPLLRQLLEQIRRQEPPKPA